MSTLNELLARAQEVRDEQAVGGNTALRVGQLLTDIIQWCADTDADFVESVEHYVAQLNERDGIINWWQSRVLILKTMGSDFDDVDVSTLNDGDLYYDSVGKWLFEREDGGSVNGHHPSDGVLYVNKRTGKTYLWDDTEGEMVERQSPVKVINDLTTGGEGDALSAEMGKWLYTNLYTIFLQLAPYAFLNGKPQIDWGGGNPPVIPPCTVSKTIGTGLSSTGGDSDVAFGAPLEVSIAVTNNLYIVDDDSVVVTMGGSPVQGAWNASTMKVTIAAVTGNVVINVPSLTYVSSGLVFHLDCKNRGGQRGHWIDRIGNIDYVLTDVTEADTGMVFNGSTSKAVSNSDLNVMQASGTIEIIATRANNNGTVSIFTNNVDGGISAFFYPQDNVPIATFYCGTSNPGRNISFPFNNLDIRLSVTADTFLVDGEEYTGAKSDYRVILGSGHSSVGYRMNAAGTTELFLNGTIKAIRIYNTPLSLAQMKRNYKIDKKRFNLT